MTVLAVGNEIMGDDGVGPALLAGLAPRWADDPRVELVAGGTDGLALLPVVEDAARLLILDAVAAEGPPGTVVELHGDQVPRLLGQKLSPHQVGLLDVLVAARLLGREPAEVAVVGIVPASVELAVGLDPAVAAALPDALAAADAVVAAWLTPSPPR